MQSDHSCITNREPENDDEKAAKKTVSEVVERVIVGAVETAVNEVVNEIIEKIVEMDMNGHNQGSAFEPRKRVQAKKVDGKKVPYLE